VDTKAPCAVPPKIRSSVGIGAVTTLNDGSSVLIENPVVDSATTELCQALDRVR